ASNAEAFSEDFYRYLFSQHPEIKPLFAHVEMATMQAMLMRMIGVIIRGLHNLPEILPGLRDVGLRHVGYGVRPEHFAFAEAALLHTLALHLGAAFTSDVRQGWQEVLDLIQRAMLDSFPRSLVAMNVAGENSMERQ